jgi:tetratricopeptide (TPR) repeat protein
MTKKSQSRSGRGEKRFKPPPQGPRTHPSPARSPDLASAFDRVVALHQAGRLPGAAELYRAILNAKPDDFDCLHLLGVIYHQGGDHEQAVRHIDTALKINPRLASAHNNRGNALSELQRIVEALADTDRFCRHIEIAYATMWELRQRGEKPQASASRHAGLVEHTRKWPRGTRRRMGISWLHLDPFAMGV